MGWCRGGGKVQIQSVFRSEHFFIGIEFEWKFGIRYDRCFVIYWTDSKVLSFPFRGKKSIVLNKISYDFNTTSNVIYVPMLHCLPPILPSALY